MTDGMMDIGSMSMESASQSGGRNVRQKKPAVQKIDIKLLIAAGVAALVLIVVAAVVIAGAAGRGKAKKAVEKLGEILSLSADKNFDVNDLLDDLLDFYEECYPKECYDVFEDELKKASNVSSYMGSDGGEDEGITLDIISVISVTSIKDSECMDMFLDDVADEFDKLGVKLKARDIDVSKAYLVLSRMDMDGESVVATFLVLKVNGKYGVYGMEELSVSLY